MKHKKHWVNQEREAEVEKEIEKFKTDAENKISELKNLSSKTVRPNWKKENFSW